MLDSQQSLLPLHADREPLTAFCVGLHSGNEEEDQEAIAEMKRLLYTLGVKLVGHDWAVVRRVNPATYVGKGKLDLVHAKLEETQADIVVVDAELSPNQLRNIEKVLDKPTLDRPGVIIEIFSQHARTKEAKTQVEIARLQYLLPRLAHFWTHFERQRGGIGQKGMGEKQIEVDRRLVKKRIGILRERLKSIEDSRKIQRSGRKEVLKVALVGYTNAGKSTLLNALTRSDVIVEDKLFSTLDSSVRSLNPHSHPPIVAIDTVGFIERLPPALIASFRSTLEELHEADLLVHVVDGSSVRAKDQIAVTEKVLKELHLAQKPRMLVLNKMDLAKTPEAKALARVLAPGAIRLSALHQKEVIALRDRILQDFQKELELWEIVVPYSESKLESQLRAHGVIEKVKYVEAGTFYRVKINRHWAEKLRLNRYR